ncbi:MAG: hypothetical protein ACRC7O_04555 [Fimbriiglobus sp.]
MGWAGPDTDRQIHAWQEWFLYEMDRPGKTDYYLMAVRAELRAIDSRKAVDVNSMRLDFKPAVPTRPEDRKAEIELSKQIAMSRVGGAGNVEIRYADRPTGLGD